MEISGNKRTNTQEEEKIWHW